MLLAAIPTVGLDGVANFRLVSPSLPGIYRSAALERATAADAAEILDRYKIRTIIDLRNEDEIDKARASATQFGRSLCAAYDGCEPVGPGCLASEGSGWLCRERVPLLADVDAFWSAVEAKLAQVKKQRQQDDANLKTLEERNRAIAHKTREDQLNELVRMKREMLNRSLEDGDDVGMAPHQAPFRGDLEGNGGGSVVTGGARAAASSWD